MRKDYVTVTARLVIRVDDDNVKTTEVLENMDYSFASTNRGAEIEETEIRDWEIEESR
jgi:hypothetical protein